VWAPGGLLETTSASAASAALTDALGSVRAQVAGGGAVTTSDYDVFGAARSALPSGLIAFAGEQRDTSGLYNLRAREYQPSLGRFLSADVLLPAGPGTQGYNRYAYAGNDPTTKVDPSGQQAFVESRLLRIIATAYVAAALTLVFREQLTRSLTALVEVLAPPVEHAVDDADQALRDWFNRNFNKPDPEPKPKASPKPIPCIPGLPPCNLPTRTRDNEDSCPITGQPKPADRIGGVPVFCVYLHRTPDIYGNDTSAQSFGFPGLPPRPLHYESDSAARNANRTAALKGEPSCEPVFFVDYSRDEYPFASTKEGGANLIDVVGRKAFVKCVPVSEQNAQRDDLNAFYRVELNYVGNSPFYVIPVPY
jgi:RHS repeat-associated protein